VGFTDGLGVSEKRYPAAVGNRILFSLERQVFGTGLFRLGFPTKILHSFLVIPNTPARKKKYHFDIFATEITSFLDAFAKLRKATISFVMPVRLSVRMERLCFHWTDFNEIWYLSIFQKPVVKIQMSLKSDKNKGYFT